MIVKDGITYPAPRLSASRIKQINECSWLFWVVNYLKIPEIPHPKAEVGTLSHLIFEVLSNPRHKKHYDQIVNTNDVYSSKSISRLIKRFLHYHVIPNKILEDLNDLVQVGLKYDFFFKGAYKILEPEYEFNLPIKNNVVKGLIDRGAFFDKMFVIRDFKSQAKLFTQEELDENVQGFIYQFAIQKIFGLRSRLEFVMLRHDKIQTIEPYSEKELKGIENYLNYLAVEFEQFNEEKAKTNFKAEKKESFCRYVCQFREPKTYYAAFENGQLKETSMDNNKLSKYKDVRLMRYSGCPFWYNRNGQKRNFN